jgi:replicative DNA helicase Mcm
LFGDIRGYKISRGETFVGDYNYINLVGVSLKMEDEEKINNEEISTADIIKKFHYFFEKYHYTEIVENARHKKFLVSVNFKEMSKFDPDLANYLLDQPDEVIRSAEISIEEFGSEYRKFRVRLTDLSDTQKLLIRNIRSEHLNKIFTFDGTVRQKSDVRPQVTSAKFECPSCGNVINILQLDVSFKEPYSCSCGRKGKFRLLNKELVDAQGLVLEETAESLEGGEQPKRINVLLKDDLVSPISEKKTSPGSKISVIGIIKEVPIILRTGTKSTRFDLLIEANNVSSIDETFYEVLITGEEEAHIKELAKDNRIYEILVNSLAPSIFGYDKIKEALILQLMGGVRKVRKDKIVSRGDIHVLLVGDPGSGKSALLKRLAYIAPKGRYVSGKGISAAGITASVVRDEFLKGWALEAGAMVLASDGICVVDEMDKMSKEDTSAMHEALENQTVSISKANIQATLISRTTVLAAANPKLGRFNPYDIIGNQIDLPPPLINRFDLIFPIHDIPDETKDKEMAEHILSLHKNPDLKEPEIPTNILRKYVAYARQRISPVLTDSAIEEIKNYYVKMRLSGGSEDGIRAIPITPRQLEALVRLSEASSRVRLSDKVTKNDARRAIELIQYCLMQVGFDKETGKFDIDRIAVGITASQRNIALIVKEIIHELHKNLGEKEAIPIDNIIEFAKSKGIDTEKFDDAIYKLKQIGEIYEPRQGFIAILK